VAAGATLRPTERSDVTKIEHDTWIVIGDGEKALFLRNEGDERFPNFATVRVLQHENPPTREQGTDRPGRYEDGLGPQSSAVENTDWHRIEKTRFARTIAETLYAAAHRGDFKKLVMVAPPHVLGDLRKEYHKEVAERVVAEVDKTLTNHPVREIERILKADFDGR
jgi:protein required for attachment to host cells